MTSPGPDLAVERLQRALAGEYEIVRELGRGGMATVYLAREIAHDRFVALKVLRAEPQGFTDGDRFQREIRILARLQHPNILSLYDSGTIDSGDGERLPYFTMPYIEGESLRARLAAGRPLDTREALRIIGEIADALSSAHAAGIVHRDLKPENVLLSQGHAMVSDFGIAKAVSGATGPGFSTITGLVLGTPAYMSPEQAMGEAADHRTDLYSLGVMAYELLTGEQPFPKRSPQQMLVAHATEHPTPIREKTPQLDPGVAALVMQMLDKSPDKRPGTAMQVVKELETHVAPARGERSRASPAMIGGAIAVAAVAILAGWQLTRTPAGQETGAADAALAGAIAVLPLENASGDSSRNYFADGMTEQIMVALRAVEGMRVTPRSSAFAFRGRAGEYAEIRDKLRVAHVLEGTIHAAGNQLRITVFLTDVTTEKIVWQKQYTRAMSDVFVVQDEIATNIVDSLRIRLSGVPGAAIATAGTQNVEAYHLYLRGRYFAENRTDGDLRAALRLYREAIDKDSAFARAYTGIADAYTLLVVFGYDSSPETVRLAHSAVAKALRLNKHLAEAYTSLGMLQVFHDWDWPGARTSLERAISLDPRYVPARLFHAWYLAAVGNAEEAVREMRRGIDIDPLNKIMLTRLGTMLQLAGRDSDAVAAFEKVIALDSTHTHVYPGAAASWARLNQCDRANRATAKAIAEFSRTSSGVDLASAIAKCWNGADARRYAADLEAHASEARSIPEELATLYAVLGEKDRALKWLEKAYAQHSMNLHVMRIDPGYASLRGDPRFEAIVARLNFPR